MNQFFSHDGIRFRYQASESGLPVVFGHGLGGDLEASQELLGDPEGYRFIVWDCRGHGGTEPLGPVEKLTFSSMVDDLAGLLDHLEVQEAVIGGISMGAGVAAQYALRHSGRVRALVLVRPAWLDSAIAREPGPVPSHRRPAGNAGPGIGRGRVSETGRSGGDGAHLARGGRFAGRSIPQAGGGRTTCAVAQFAAGSADHVLGRRGAARRARARDWRSPRPFAPARYGPGVGATFAEGAICVHSLQI